MKNLLFFFLFTFLLHSLKANPYELSIANTSKFLSNSKKKDTGFDKTRLLIGPGIGAGAGQRMFSLYIAPSIAYAITDNFNVGATLGFSYFQQAYDYQNGLNGQNETYKYKIPAYSMSLFARYGFANIAMVGVEPELTNTKFISENNFTYHPTTGKLVESSSRLTVPSFLVGGGLGQKISNLGYYYTMVMYDLVQNPNSRYYQTLAYRVGLMIELFPR